MLQKLLLKVSPGIPERTGLSSALFSGRLSLGLFIPQPACYMLYLKAFFSLNSGLCFSVKGYCTFDIRSAF